MNNIAEDNPTINEDLVRIVSSSLHWEMLRNKTILVAGGGGFLAAYLIKAILAANYLYSLNCRVVCVARRKASVGKRLARYINLAELITIEHDLSKPLPTSFPRVDYIIHAASQASPKYYGIDPVGTLMANTMGTYYLLQHAINIGVERFLYFSSGEVYGTPFNSVRQITETDYGKLDPMSVRSCYAESKRMGETMCVSWAHQYGLNVSVVRPFHTYGPGMALDDGRVFADFVADIVRRRDVVVKGDGAAKRSFCYVADATVAFLTVLLKGENAEAYNVGNPEAETPIRDLATVLTSLFPERNLKVHFEAPISSNAYLKSPISRSCPSIEKIKGLNWTPTTSIEEGFRRTILSFEKNDFRNQS